jgi:hypothetical protein
MVTAAQMRKLALSMPDAEEKSHFGQPDFRVRNKIFAGLSPDDTRGTLKLNPDLQSMALEGNSGAFSAAAGAWGRSGWTHVALAAVQLAELRPLVVQAWRLVAPRRLVSTYDGVHGHDGRGRGRG